MHYVHHVEHRIETLTLLNSDDCAMALYINLLLNIKRSRRGSVVWSLVNSVKLDNWLRRCRQGRDKLAPEP
jgi:hypothetical protein